MQDIAATLEGWIAGGKRFALATVLKTWGSSPRPVGAAMAVCEDGSIAGSVSGGCVEGAVIEQARKALAGAGPKLMDFEGLSDGDIWRVGLSCGGRIEVLVELPSLFAEDPVQWAMWTEALRRSRQRERFVFGVLLEGGYDRFLLTQSKGCAITWMGSDVAYGDAKLNVAAEMLLASTVPVEVPADVGTWFCMPCRPQGRVLIVGAVHIAQHLIAFASRLGFETVVIEPRKGFSEQDFAAGADEVVAAWPSEAGFGVDAGPDDYAVLLTHDPKIDDTALEWLLRSDVAYIGALGSRTTQEQRRKRLMEAGRTEAEVSRIHGPVGLAIGARTPQEIALSIMAEIVQVHRGG